MKIILPIIVIAAVAGLVAVILRARRTAPKKADGISTEQAARPIQFQADMRKRLLQGSPTEFGIDAKTMRKGVWGALMETGYPEGTATVVCLCDGTASLYMGRGGGIIGGHAHEDVRATGAKFLDLAADYVQGMGKAEAYPMPDNGRVRFYVMTSSGVFTVDVEEQALGAGQHPLSPLFYGGHDVITQLRNTTEQGRKSREETDSLLDNAVKAAIHFLEKNGEFYPFGVALRPDGRIALVASYDGKEHPKSDEVLALLYPGLKQGVRKDEYRAVAIVTDMKIRKTPSDEPKDALRIQIEHPNAAPVACYLPYRLEAGKFVQGELTAGPAKPLVIGPGE